MSRFAGIHQKIIIFAFVFCAAAALLPPGIRAHNHLAHIRHWSSPTSTRIVFDLKHQAAYESFTLSSPERLVVDLTGFDGHVPRESINIGDGIIRTIRASKNRSGVVRIVVDLEKKAQHTIFPLKAFGSKPPRLVIDITRPDLEKAARTKRQRTRALKSKGSYIVVVDPGHGGEDPGAVIRGRTREKDIVFAVSRKLAQQLNRTKNIKAYLTRKGDYFISLRKRIDIAQQYGADLFISIHADSSFSKKVRGSSVYCLSFKGATSNTARMLARKENASDYIGGVPLDKKNNDLSAIIFDLVQTHSLNASLQCAGVVLKQLSKINRLHAKKPHQANFVVLRAPDIPSILIELDFLSNPYMERRLKNSHFQSTLARYIAEAVEQYCESDKAPPPVQLIRAGTGRQHIVKKGDTLSELALKHGVSVSDLRRANGLTRSDVLKIGTTLHIPGAGTQRIAAVRPSSHRVRRGDTLSELALKYDTTVSALRRANGLTRSDVLKIGTTLRIPGAGTQRIAAVRPSSHRVRRGDTLSELALKYDTTVSALRRANGLTRSDVLKIGTTLRIPGAGVQHTAATHYHRVRRGETLSDIALRYGKNVSTLRRMNGMDRSDLLLAGTKLKIR